MSEDITKEIRDCAINVAHITNGAHFEFDRIVDGIDSYFYNALQYKQDEIYKLNFDIGNAKDKLAVSMLLPVDADGVICKLGDKMYIGSLEFSISGFGRVDDIDVVFYDDDGWSWLNVAYCHHASIDSQERINCDCGKTMEQYWHCKDLVCDDCTAKIDGKKPFERYNVIRCVTAMNLDLVARQRKLDSES